MQKYNKDLSLRPQASSILNFALKTMMYQWIPFESTYPLTLFPETFTCAIYLSHEIRVFLLFLLYTSRKEKFFIEGLLIEGYMQDRDQIN